MISTASFISLTTIEKDIALAFFEKRLSEYDFSELVVKMDALIIRTASSVGYKVDKEVHNGTIDELCADLQKYNATLTFQEIEIAFKNGWKKEYGDYFGLNNATYFTWVNGFTFSENRRMAKKAIADAKNNIDRSLTPTRDEKKDLFKKGVIECFVNYKLYGEVLDAGGVYYDFLSSEEIGLISLTTERKKELIKEAEVALKEEAILDLEKRKGDTTSAKAIKYFITKIEDGTHVLIKSQAKKIALKNYFDTLEGANTTMEVILKDK